MGEVASHQGGEGKPVAGPGIIVSSGGGGPKHPARSTTREIHGVTLSPAVLEGLAEEEAETCLAEGWGSIRAEGLLPLLARQYGAIPLAMRGAGDLLGSEDVFELERGTALAEFGQRVALRQVLQAADALAGALPRHKPRVCPRRARAVATPIVDEDTYPVGGAFCEPVARDQPRTRFFDRIPLPLLSLCAFVRAFTPPRTMGDDR